MSLISRLKAVVAGDEYLDEDFDDLDYESEDQFNDIDDYKQNQRKSNLLANANPFAFMNNNNQSSKVVGMPGISSGSSEVTLMEPKNYEEMTIAIQAVRERKTVIVNLSMIIPDQAQRFIDCVAGGTYAIDGYQQRIGENMFIFAPSCVNVSNISSEDASPKNISQEEPSHFGLGTNTAPEPAWGNSKLSAY